MNERRYKQAALRLAGLHPADRSWLIKRLPALQRRLLEPLIADALRIGARDAQLLDEAYWQCREAPERGSETGPGNSLARLQREDLHAALDELPVEWAAAALLLEPQSVADGYADSCDSLRRDALISAHAHQPPKARVQEALKKAILERSGKSGAEDCAAPILRSAAG
ncbi:MAG TPA: hypothetical protein VFK45_00750 [Gammaproteobacteria bacterium]|nr:hypothetical protein [Gammaproteobacteria bacterium]